MKKTKIIISVGAFVLTIGGILVTKANKKFSSVFVCVCIGSSGNIIMTLVNTNGNFTTTLSGGHRVFVAQTAGAGAFTILGGLLYRNDLEFEKNISLISYGSN